jgi:peptide/nickel transport system substrate-binding protein
MHRLADLEGHGPLTDRASGVVRNLLLAGIHDQEAAMSGDGQLGLAGHDMTRRRLLRGAAGGVAALSLPAFLAACGSGSTSSGGSTAAAPAPATTGSTRIASLVWSNNANARIDPAHSFDLSSPAVQSLGVEGLLHFDANGALQPRLAQSWSHPDELTYIFNLRPGVVFWDGSPLTPADVIYTFNQHLNPKVASEFAQLYSNVKSVTQTGPMQVTVKLSAPDAVFAGIMAHNASYIVSKAFWQAHAKTIGSPSVLTMGTGPYKIIEYAPDDHVTVVANPKYWGPKPTMDKITMKVIVDDQTRLLALQSGQVDGAFEVPLDQATQWAALPNVHVTSVPGSTSFFLTLNTEAAPWNDIHVRRAVTYALDREGLVKAILKGNGAAATSITPPKQWGSLVPQSQVDQIYASLPTYAFDMQKAKAELGMSAHPNGFTATVTYTDAYPRTGLACLALAQNLKQLGITLNVKEQPNQQWLADLYARPNLGIGTMLYFPDYPDPSDYLELFLNSQNATKNAFNLANFKDPTTDTLLAQQNGASLQPQVRATALAGVLKIAAEQLPYIPIWWENEAVAVNTKYAYTGFNPLYYFDQWPYQIAPSA